MRGRICVCLCECSMVTEDQYNFIGAFCSAGLSIFMIRGWLQRALCFDLYMSEES